jgi:hypothetical protein
MCGLWRSFPDWTARLKIRFRIVSSRLISAFEMRSTVRCRSGTSMMLPSFRTTLYA